MLEDLIKEEAHHLGFLLAGITTPDPPPHLDVYARWLEAGRQGDMGYLATERALNRRRNPGEILPGCRSIIVLGFPYPAPASPSAGVGEMQGDIAAYAWGEDYHLALKPRLEALAAFIESKAGRPVHSRGYTDSGPILERELAQRAGLGWIGKNTCLIHPQHGSYFLLAEIFLDLELQPGAPMQTDHCGTCQRCLEACPTQCILPDRTVDARRCIAYLTIELKGPIPADLRPQLGQHVFGCDICQQVCPWNIRFAALQGGPAFGPHGEIRQVDLTADLALSPPAFNQKFKNSPVQRPRRRGYLRNLAVVLGNISARQGSPDRKKAVLALTRALHEEPEPLVRQHCAWALGRLGAAEARQALRQAEGFEIDKGVLAEIRSALEQMGE